MTQRIVDVSTPARISLKNRQIVIDSGGIIESKKLNIPAEDLGLLLIDQVQCALTVPVIDAISSAGGIIVICNGHHLPVAVLQPIAAHSETVHRIQDQINAPAPITKRLWQQIIKAKILAQAANLPIGSDAQIRLKEIARKVRSGDTSNAEAQAAKVYWKAWQGFPQGVSRNPQGSGINSALNYGYAIVRAAMARALIGSGFCTAIGLHHKHRGNPFCLADDLMEPLRPMVDSRVANLAGCSENLTPEAKQALYQLLLDPVSLGDQRLPLMDSLHRVSASLAACYRREREALLLPHREEA